MNSNDSEQLYAQIRESADNLQMPTQVDQVIARGRGLRRRRTVFSAFAAVGAATAASLAFASPSSTPATTASPVADVHFHLAAWSVDVNPDQTVTVTLRELTEPQKLAQILDMAGVRAKVQFIEVPDGEPIGCYKQDGGRSLRSIRQVISSPEGAGAKVSVNITPSAMPAGSILNFVVFGHAGLANTTRITLTDGEPGPCLPFPTETPQPIK